MEEKSVKETLLGTSESNVTPFTLNFPSSDKSKYWSKDLALMRLRTGTTGSFGGAIDQANKRRRTEEKLYGKTTKFHPKKPKKCCKNLGLSII